MHRIATHIEHLLLVHDCVIIPGFGGFVLQAISGEYFSDEHTFSPMRKEVIFNTALQHNDGLLTESYMQVYAIDFQKARRMLDEDVHELQAVLEHYRKATFGAVGSFSLGKEKQIIFQPNKNESFDVNNYGLSAFHFHPLSAVLDPEEKEARSLPVKINKEKREIFYIPVNRRIVRTVVASVAAIGLFLLISTPVKDVNQSAYTASFIPSDIMTAAPPVVLAPTGSIPEANAAENSEETTAEAAIIKPAALQEENKVSEEAPAPVQVVKKQMYHVVIASFPSEKQARIFIHGVDKNRFGHTNIIHRDKKFRVYANKFESRREADTFAEQLWKSSIYRDAWVYASK